MNGRLPPSAAIALSAFTALSLAAAEPKKSVVDRAKPITVAPVGTGPAAPAAKHVLYGEEDVVKINAKLRYTTLLVLPKSEKILDFICGDKEFWVVNGNENLAYIKPAKPGSQTNLSLVTASGNIYSFLLEEVSESSQSPDLKVFLEPKEDSMLAAAKAPQRFVSAREVDECRQQVELAKAELQQGKDNAQASIDAAITRFLSNVRFPYRFEAGKKPFLVRAIYHDDRFTYIQARPEETPTLFEIKDGKPNLIQFEYKNGVYVTGKIIDRGYLAIGKLKLEFVRQE